MSAFGHVFYVLLITFSGLLNTIVFHRALGLVRPKDVDCELFEITYVSLYILYKLFNC